MPIERIYLDMDGVLADFEKAIGAFGAKPYPDGKLWISKPRETWPPEMVTADAAYVGVMERPDFWPTFAACPGAYELWDYCKSFDLHVLTATPERTEHRDRIAQQKREWIWDHFGMFPTENIIICRRAEKAAFSRPGHVLVDDTPSNCVEWLKGGGNSVLHATAQNSISHLRDYHHG